MTRIPRNGRRRLAVVGMVGVLPLATLLWLIAAVAVDNDFSGIDAAEGAQAERAVVFATIAAIAALISLVGLAIRWRGVALVGSFGVSGAGFAVLLDWQLIRLPGDLGGIGAVALVIVCAGLAGIRAALAPTPSPLEVGREAAPDRSGAARPSP